VDPWLMTGHAATNAAHSTSKHQPSLTESIGAQFDNSNNLC
jgi:hypothetical protein